MKRTSKQSKQPKSFFKSAAPATAKPAAPKPIDERDFRHISGGLPHTRW